MATYAQTEYSINPEVGYVGDISRPNEAFTIDTGRLYIATGAAVESVPGAAVFWNIAQNAYEVADSSADLLRVTGILHYRKDDVQDASDDVVFIDGQFVEVCVLGSIWVTAGAGVEYDQIISFQTDGKWDGVARVSGIADIVSKPVVSVSRFTAADNSMIEARIGYGRVI